VLKRAAIGACVGAISLLSFGGLAGASAKSQVTDWAKQNKAATAKIHRDIEGFTTAGDTGDLKKLKTACNQLASDVASAQKRAPIPVKSLENLWSRALSDFATGANACRTAFVERDEKEPSKASASGDRASAELSNGVRFWNTLNESAG
jgi:hypothetical protein